MRYDRFGARVGRLVLAVGCTAALAACVTNTAVLVRFPLGNRERGQAAFIALECHACHRLQDVQLPAHPGPSSLSIPLGGHTPRIETFGDIITAIVNPSHRLARGYRQTAGRGESPMAAEFLNDVMTTQQLVDIASLLRTEYEYVPPPPPPYWESYPDGEGDSFGRGRDNNL